MTVTTLRIDRTAADRARRYRQRRRNDAVTSAGRWRDAAVTVIVMSAALALAAVSASFAIGGLTAIFHGALLPIVAMGGAMESGKLAAVAWLGRAYTASVIMKAVMAALVIVLMSLNALGCYGFLARAHLDHAVTNQVAVDAKAADVNARTQIQAAVVADLDTRIAQVDTAVDEAVRRGRTTSAMALATQETRYRSDLTSQRLIEAKKLAELQVQAAAVVGDRARFAADSGPVHYLAALIGADDDGVMRWFILVVAVLLDPLAVVLLLAASITRARLEDDAP